MSITRCPCCAGPIVGETFGLMNFYPRARTGDRWCPTCDWLLVKEHLLDGEFAGSCPSHPTPLFQPAAGQPV